MRRLIAASALAIAVGIGAADAQTINVATAGDQNMVDYVRDYLGPMFEKKHPGAKVVAVGTGPGDAGSQKIFEKLDAQKAAATTDFDVVVIHQKAAGTMVKEGLLAKYTDKVDTAKLVSSQTASNALGADVSASKSGDAGRILADRITWFMQRLKVPNGLRALSYSSSDIPALVEGTLPQHRVTKLSPKPAGPEELGRLFEDAMTAW